MARCKILERATLIACASSPLSSFHCQKALREFNSLLPEDFLFFSILFVRGLTEIDGA